jgi:PPOX class probable F420-dependent enzyme
VPTPTQDTRRLGGERYVSLATFRRDGREVRTPVWVAECQGRLYVFSEAKAGKVKRIRATRRVGLAACDVRGGLRGDFSAGTGRVVSEPDVIERAYAAFRGKYGLVMWLTNLFSTLTGRIHRRAMLEIELSS